MSQLLSTAHVPTMMLMILIISGAMALAVSYVAWGQPASGSLHWWGWSMGLNTFAFLAFANAPGSGGFGWVALGNALLVTSLGLAQRAVAVFTGVRWHAVWLGLPLILVVIASLWWHDQPSWRTPAVDGALLVHALGLMWLAAQHRQTQTGTGIAASPRGRRLLTLGAGLVAFVYLQRLLTALLQPIAALALTHPGMPQTSSYVLGLVGLVLASLGFILMHQERAETLLSQMAMQDALTGVANRRGVMDALERSVAQAARQGEPLGVLMVDIDHFKRVNDTHGHPVGDEVLRQVAQRLQSRLRGQDVLGRYGGEEFLVVLPQTDAAGALTVAETLRQRVADSALRVGTLTVPVTVSVGLCCCRPSPGAQTGWALVALADRALYRAKEQGRNQTQVEEAGALCVTPA